MSIHKRPLPVPTSATSVQSMHPHPMSCKFILILSSHLTLGLPSGLLPSGLPTENLYAPLLSPTRDKSPAHLILLDLITWWGAQILKLHVVQSSQNLSYLVPHRPKYLPNEITQYGLNEVIDCFWNHTYRGTTSRTAHTFLYFSCISVSRNRVWSYRLQQNTPLDTIRNPFSGLNNQPQTSYSDSQEDAFKKGTKILHAFIVAFPELQAVC
jgi:hypothetical protein